MNDLKEAVFVCEDLTEEDWKRMKERLEPTRLYLVSKMKEFDEEE